MLCKPPTPSYSSNTQAKPQAVTCLVYTLIATAFASSFLTFAIISSYLFPCLAILVHQNGVLSISAHLVPESDDGNVEYKLQLLSPSPARFTRLVTQLKLQLLEGGGQAYYELSVSNSGDLIGLLREDG